MHIKVWLENLKGRYHMQDLGIDGRYIKIKLKETVWEKVG
jgi:hypothetical protein